MQNSIAKQLSWDMVGVTASALCAVHCLATPLLVAFLPTSGLPFLKDELFHPVMALLVIVLAFVAFKRGFAKHGSFYVTIPALCGIFLLLVAAMNFGHFLEEPLERTITISGGTLVSISHIWNWLRVQSSGKCCD